MDRFKSAALSHEQVMTILERSRSAHHLYPADILEIVIRQPAESFRTIVQHLLSDKLAKRRCSGLQMLLQADEERARPCVELVRDFLSKRKHGSRLETQLITQVGARFAPWLADDPQATPTSKLFPELTYSPPFEPVRSDVLALTEATRRFVTSLAEFVAAHEAGIVAAKMQAQDPWTRMQKLSQVHLSDDWGSELDSLWSDWYRSRGPDTRNADGRELMQAAMLSRNIYVERYRLEDDVWADWKARGIDLSELVALQKTVEASREALQPVLTRFLASVIDRLCKLHGDWNHWAYRINVAETICAAVPREVLSQVTSPYNIFEGTFPVEKWLWLPAWQSLAEMPEDLLRRLFRLRTWICQPHPAMHVLWLGVGEVELAAYGRGIATLGDLVRCLMPNTMPAFQYELPASLRYENYRYLRRRYPAAAAEFESFMQRLLKTLVESELTRDPRSPTPLSPLCELVKYAEGSQWFEQVLVATAKKGLTRPKMNITAHRELLSSLLSNLYPAASDDMQQVASRLRELLEKKKVTLEHLIQAAFLAPQWARAIESAIGWAGLWEIGEWFAWHLLSDDGKYSLAAWLSPANEACRRDSELDDRHGRLDIKRFYEEQIKQRFSQSPGVACREWFYQLPNEFTNDQWQTIYAALEGITHPSSFRQVVNMCEALRGTLDRQELFDRLSNATKPQDLKPLGLLPISQGESRTMEVLERMRVLTQYCRRIAKFSKWDYSENEWKLVDQVKELLAVNAGFGSVTQLEWFVESAMAEELEKYEVVEVGPTKLRLAIDAQGTPSLEIVKAGKPLKAIPAAVKKDPACVEQQRLLKSLKTFAVEARKTLEHALVEQLRYDIDDLQQMLAHPILRRMFEGVLLTDGTHIGLLGKDGTSLCGPDGEAALDKSRPVWLVHPLDLRSHGGWMRWRDWLRDRGIVQPLPQVERGYFVASDFLRDGRRVQPIFPPLMRSDQARAILHNRGWEFEFSSDGERRFSSAHVIAHTEFRGIFLRSDVLQLHDVVFEVLDKNNFEIAKHFEDIPEIPFSETMRDLYTAVLGAAMDDEPVDEE
ncbi:MAG: DUF5724 domain-containing protein, partial [Aureliella sp.]